MARLLKGLGLEYNALRSVEVLECRILVVLAAFKGLQGVQVTFGIVAKSDRVLDPSFR